MKFLPDQPNLEYLRREAQTLKSQHRARDESIVPIIGHFDTSMHGLSAEAVFTKRFSILDAQRVTARLYCFSSWARLKAFVQKSTDKQECFNAELCDTILRRKMEYDARLRRYKKKKWKSGAVEKWDRFSEESAALFKDIYRQYGWPGPNIIGRKAVEASFYLSSAAVHDSEFQHLTINMMKDALPKGECFGSFYASLLDRYLCLKYQPSMYGTMCDYNTQTGRVEPTQDIADIENVNIRRAEVGLPDLAASNKELIEYLTKRGLHQRDQDDWENYKRKEALKGGYIQHA